MTFLTNKPLNSFKDVSCKMSGYTFDEVDALEIPDQVVIDISNEYSTRALQQIISKFHCKYISSPMELNPGNTVYVILDGAQSILKIDAI